MKRSVLSHRLVEWELPVFQPFPDLDVVVDGNPFEHALYETRYERVGA